MVNTQRIAIILSSLVVLGAAAYQVLLRRFVETQGFFRTAIPVGNTDCTIIEGVFPCSCCKLQDTDYPTISITSYLSGLQACESTLQGYERRLNTGTE